MNKLVRLTEIIRDGIAKNKAYVCSEDWQGKASGNCRKVLKFGVKSEADAMELTPHFASDILARFPGIREKSVKAFFFSFPSGRIETLVAFDLQS